VTHENFALLLMALDSESDCYYLLSALQQWLGARCSASAGNSREETDTSTCGVRREMKRLPERWSKSCALAGEKSGAVFIQVSRITLPMGCVLRASWTGQGEALREDLLDNGYYRHPEKYGVWLKMEARNQTALHRFRSSAETIQQALATDNATSGGGHRPAGVITVTCARPPGIRSYLPPSPRICIPWRLRKISPW